MSEQRAKYTTGRTTAAPACFNCENGRVQPGRFGRYCSACDTYLPTGKTADLASAYFAAIDAGDEPRAAEIRARLEYCRQETIVSIKNANFR